MQLIVNGEVHEIEAIPTVGAFLTSRDLDPKMVVVEQNGEIVSRGQYDETPLAHGDVLEIVQMMAGG